MMSVEKYVLTEQSSVERFVEDVGCDVSVLDPPGSCDTHAFSCGVQGTLHCAQA
jgi:hypothetical protein